MNVIELGNYLAPAYAGMLLAEQGHFVTKWLGTKPDPILSLRRGKELWSWVNSDKTMIKSPAANLSAFLASKSRERVDVIIENFTPGFLAEQAIDPLELAARHNLIWISIRSEVGERSFDIVAQARSTLEFCPYIPFYIGDTAAGLFAAFKACSAYARKEVDHYVLGQASCLQKLVEGELMIDERRTAYESPWDTDLYNFDPIRAQALVHYKSEIIAEPVRDRAWKLEHLYHKEGRIII